MSSRKKSKRRPTSTAEAPSSTGRTLDEFWNRIPRSRQHLICLFLLLAVSLAFFAPVHFQGGALVGGDTVNWRAMAHAMQTYEADTGRDALWSPNTFGGMPGYMISYPLSVPQADVILNWARKLVWPTSHLFVLMAGVYVVLILVSGSKLAGLLSAGIFGLTTYLPVILVAGHNTKFIALAFAPWLVASFLYTLRRPTLLSALFFAVVLALNLRAGHVQITYYFTFLLAVWWLSEGVSAIRQGAAAQFARTTMWLVLGGVLALLMVAQPYLATAEYKQYTIRGAGEAGAAGLAWDYAMGWSQGLGELLTLAVANAYGGSAGTYWGPKAFTAGPHYVGGVALALAIVAVIRRRSVSVAALSIGGALMVCFALGEHFSSLNRFMFTYFPLFNAFRVPETWLAAVAFCVAVLAGVGASALVMRPDARGNDADGPRHGLVVLAAVAAVLLGLVIFRQSLLDFERPGEATLVARQIAAGNNVDVDDPRVSQAANEYVAQQRVERETLFAQDAFRSLIFVLLAAATIFLYRRKTMPDWLMLFLLALFVVADLFGVGRRYVRLDTLARSENVEKQIPRYDFDEYIEERIAEAGGSGHFRVLSLEGDPTVTARPSFYYESLGGYHGAKLRTYQHYLDEVLIDRPTSRPRKAALDLMNVRYVVSPRAIPGLDVRYKGDRTGYLVLENTDYLPRAHFAAKVEVNPSLEEVRQDIASGAVDIRTTAVLQSEPTLPLTPLDSASVVRVALTTFSPRAIEWDVESDGGRILVISENYYPAGWKAMLNDVEIPILRANYLLRAVEIPAGRHRLKMAFEPVRHATGVRVSAVATLFVYAAVVGLLFVGWLRRRDARRKDANDDDRPIASRRS